MACVAEEVCPPTEVTTAVCAFRYTLHEMNCGAAIVNVLNNSTNEYLSYFRLDRKANNQTYILRIVMR